MKAELGRVGRFIIGGGTAAAVTFTTLYVLHGLFGFWYLTSSVIGYVAGVGVNFVLQKMWTFKARSGDARSQAGIFIMTNMATLLLNTAIVFLCVEVFLLNYLLAQLFASVLVACVSFFAYRRLFMVSNDDLSQIPTV